MFHGSASLPLTYNHTEILNQIVGREGFEPPMSIKTTVLQTAGWPFYHPTQKFHVSTQLQKMGVTKRISERWNEYHVGVNLNSNIII